MRVSTCSTRPILTPCSLNNFDFQVDPYIGCEHYCYYCYVLKGAETDWTQQIQMHDDIAGRLSKELDTIPPQKIYMGYHTDPYQPCEARLRQTRQVLKLFYEKGFSASILTKSNLVVRDMDILKEMNEASVSVSVAFNDNQTRRLFEASTLDTEDRLDALRQLKASGIQTAALICPVIPHITDVAPLIDGLAPLTSFIWIYGLNIENRSDPGWDNIQRILEQHFSENRKEIETVIFSKDHPYWVRLREKLYDLQANRQLSLSVHV